MLEIKDQYIAVFAKTINGVVTVQGKKKFKIHIDHLSFKGKSFRIDTKIVSYRNKNKFIYLIDIDNGQQIIFKDKEEIIKNSELANLIVEKKVIAQLVSGLVSVGKVPWVWAVVFIAVGLPVGYILGNIFPITP
jgi:hypothetical protein